MPILDYCGIVILISCDETHMARPQRYCIFCNGPRLSKEHVWADWLKAYIPMEMTKHSTGIAIVNKTNTESSIKPNTGDPRRRTIRVVCKTCNEGWMSKLQEKAKPFLLPLIKGERTVLGEEAQKVIAAWAAMAIMVAEFFVQHRSAIPYTERESLRQTQTVPENWKIWVGNFQRGNWPAHWIHHSLLIADEHIPSAHDSSLPQPNTQTTTFVAGRLFIHAFSCPFKDMVARCTPNGPLAQKIAQIFPFKESAIIWPLNVISDREADNIAGNIFWSLDALGRKFGS
jgi:hypothetical protein